MDNSMNKKQCNNIICAGMFNFNLGSHESTVRLTRGDGVAPVFFWTQTVISAAIHNEFILELKF